MLKNTCICFITFSQESSEVHSYFFFSILYLLACKKNRERQENKRTPYAASPPKCWQQLSLNQGGRWEPATKSKLLHVAGKNSTTRASALHPKVHMPEELEWEQSQAWNPGPQSGTASGILMTGLNADPWGPLIVWAPQLCSKFWNQAARDL